MSAAPRGTGRELAERLEQIEGVLAAAVALDPHGSARNVWIALAENGSVERARGRVVETLSRLGVPCREEAVRIGVIPAPPAPLEDEIGAWGARPAAPEDATGDGGFEWTPYHDEPPGEATPAGPASEPYARPSDPHPRTPSLEQPALAAGGAGASDSDYTAAQRFLLLDAVETRSARGHVHARVALTRIGRTFTGEAEDVDNEAGRARAGARAALLAASNAAGGPRLALVALQILPLFGERYLALAVDAMHGRRASRLSGLVPIESSVEDAAALAALRAVERWIAW